METQGAERKGTSKQTHLNHDIVLPDTARNPGCFVGYRRFRELPAFWSDTIMPPLAYIHDARHARGWWA